MMRVTSLLHILSVWVFLGCTIEQQSNSINTSGSISIQQRINNEKSENQEIENKIQELLGQMTLEEKIGQMIILNNSQYSKSESVIVNPSAPPITSITIDTTKLISYIKDYKVGCFLNATAIMPEQWVAYSQQLQKINMRYNRLKIPIIYGVDMVHGSNYIKNGTVFPHNFNIGATFNKEIAKNEGEVTATEISDLGHHWNFAPVLDMGRNYVFPRYYETFGEDPYLTATMGAAYIKGQQETSLTAPYQVASTAKHFIGYSDPLSGSDRTPADISNQTLQEFWVPAFQKAIDAGVKTFMINGGEVNGQPLHASYKYLTELLRDQMGFKGVVVTDWEDIIRLYTMHKVVENMKEAVYQSITAGIDVSMPPYDAEGFFNATKELVKEGRLSEDRINLSVARILRLKLEIGLFENPYPSDKRLERIGSEDHSNKNLQAARESIVLMKNENNVLPLNSSVKNVLVVGPNADNKRGLCGGWTYVWIPGNDDLFPEDMPTVYSGLQDQLGGVNVTLGDEKSLSANTKVDAIILVLGEEPYSETQGVITDLKLDDAQQRLVDRAANTGIPVILVMVAGRPRLITEAFGKSDAVIWAGLPGLHGGTAIAEIIAGKVNPSGKMSFSYPANPNRMHPYTYKNSQTFAWAWNIQDGAGSGLDLSKYTIGEFGTGLSYTTYTYSDLVLSDTVITKGQKLKAEVKVTNTGEIDGKEAILWFISDEVGSVSRPVRLLKYFEKETLKAGETKRFTFEIDPMRDLSFPNDKGERLLEKGYFTISVEDKKTRFLLQ